ncbi:hypothetical protein [Streptomyces sp. SM12]|uniref:hypothetical protein n=1 Tax=Streptomyces sp. SM12 TaxID=1071602 RepID=UPI0011B0AE55|nr:hypothetical protein [Streptomyces sp. SM12]
MISNADRAELAQVAVDAYLAALQRHGSVANPRDFAPAGFEAVEAYFSATRHGPLDELKPSADFRDIAEEAMSDLSCDLRHLADRHGRVTSFYLALVQPYEGAFTASAQGVARCAAAAPVVDTLQAVLAAAATYYDLEAHELLINGIDHYVAEVEEEEGVDAENADGQPYDA